MQSSFDFLSEVYLQGYFTLTSQDYSGKKGWFGFNPIEPSVTMLSSQYWTPRGSHITISQAAYCFWEELMIKDLLDIDIMEFRKFGCEGKLKLTELNQKFRREVNLDSPLQGRFIVTRIRNGKIPIVKMDFDLAEGSFTGDLTGLVAPRPLPQTNANFLRINPN